VEKQAIKQASGRVCVFVCVRCKPVCAWKAGMGGWERGGGGDGRVPSKLSFSLELHLTSDVIDLGCQSWSSVKGCGCMLAEGC